VDHFGKKRVFRDVDHLRPGDDFVESLARAVGSCDAFILVIGRDWLDARDERGARRLEDPQDFIRIELETAIRRKVLLLPVLVEGAKMMDASELPEPLRPLARRQAIELSEHRWDFDVHELLQRLEEVVKPERSIWKRPTFRISAAVVLLAAVAFGTRSYWLPDNLPANGGAGQTAVKPDTPATGGTTKAGETKTTSPPPAPTTPVRGPVASVPPKPTTLPQFVDQPFRAAADSLKDLGLNLRVEFNSTGRKPPGTVFNQLPAAGYPLTGLETVELFVETALRPEEHAAGSRYLSVSEVMMLDSDEGGTKQAWDVGLQRASGSNLMLQFGNGATGVRVSPASSNRAGFDPAQCRAVTATWSDKGVLIPQKLDNTMDVCVRTTKGRLALVRLEELTAKPELKLRFSTLR
jgi:hypothetical protein